MIFELFNRLKLTFGLQPSYFKGMDVSHWEPDIDWELARNDGIGYAFIKTSQGIVADLLFQIFWSEAKGIVPRGAFHLYDGRYNSPQAQVDVFLSQLGDDLGELPLVLDVEDGYADVGPYGGWANWKLFLEELKTRVDHEIMIYTAPYFWRDNVPAGELEYFKQYPLWIANYGVSAPRVPASWGNFDQSSGWLFWQYSDAEYINGITDHGQATMVDVNYFNGSKADFYIRFGLDLVGPGITEDIVDYPPQFENKVKHSYIFRRYPRPYYAHVVEFVFEDVAKVHTNGLSFSGTAKYFHDSRQALGRPPDIVINGDHGSPGLPYGFVVTDGEKQKITTVEDCLQWDKDSKILGVAYELLPGVYNCVGCSDILLQNAAPPPPPDTTDDVSVDPRTCIFWNATGYILLSVEGRNNGTLGLTRKEAADVGLSLGATWGVNLDGGDSCSLVFDDGYGDALVINNPPEGVLKQVVQHVGFWIKRSGDDNDMADELYEYDVVNPVGLRSYTKADVGHTAPSMFSNSIQQIQPGTYRTSKDKFSNDGVDWADYKGLGAIPMSWNGVVYIESFHEVGVDPPPPPGTPQIVKAEVKIYLDNDTVIEDTLVPE